MRGRRGARMQNRRGACAHLCVGGPPAHVPLRPGARQREKGIARVRESCCCLYLCSKLCNCWTVSISSRNTRLRRRQCSKAAITRSPCNGTGPAPPPRAASAAAWRRGHQFCVDGPLPEVHALCQGAQAADLREGLGYALPIGSAGSGWRLRVRVRPMMGSCMTGCSSVGHGGGGGGNQSEVWEGTKRFAQGGRVV